MSKTKTIRARHEDAYVIEQAVREVAAKIGIEVKVSDLMKELIKHVPEARKDLENKIKNNS